MNLSNAAINDLLNLLEGIREGIEYVGCELRMLRKALELQQNMN